MVLWTCLARLVQQLPALPPAEILLINNSDHHWNLPDALNCVRQIHRPRRASAAHARNEGARLARGRYLVFVDSDVWLEANAVVRLIAPLQRDAADATVGNYSTDIRGLRFAQGFKQLYIHHVYAERGLEMRHDFWTAISAVRADRFRQLNGFDDSFDGACGEDMEFGIRATRAGLRLLRVPKARGQHHHDYTLAGLVRNDWRKGRTVMRNTLRARTPLTDHSHAAPRNVRAVAAAGALVAGVVGSIWWPPLVVVAGVSATVWLIAKRGLLQLFARVTSLPFVVAAIPLLFSLDLVRGGCVAVALLEKWFVRAPVARREPWIPQISPTKNEHP